MKLENDLDYINDSLITKRIIEKYKNQKRYFHFEKGI